MDHDQAPDISDLTEDQQKAIKMLGSDQFNDYFSSTTPALLAADFRKTNEEKRSPDKAVAARAARYERGLLMLSGVIPTPGSRIDTQQHLQDFCIRYRQ